MDKTIAEVFLIKEDVYYSSDSDFTIENRDGSIHDLVVKEMLGKEMFSTQKINFIENMQGFYLSSRMYPYCTYAALFYGYVVYLDEYPRSYGAQALFLPPIMNEFQKEYVMDVCKDTDCIAIFNISDNGVAGITKEQIEDVLQEKYINKR